MNKKLLLTSLLLTTWIGLQGAGDPVMYHAPGTPPQRHRVCNRAARHKPLVSGESCTSRLKLNFNRKADRRACEQVGKRRFRHQSDAIGSELWQADIRNRLRELDQQLPPDNQEHAAALKKSYDDYFSVVQQDSELVEDFLKIKQSAQELTLDEVETAKSYLVAITKHYDELSELDFNGHPAGGVVQDLVFDEDKVADLTLKTLDVKNDLEEFMGEFNLLPDDYDNGLI